MATVDSTIPTLFDTNLPKIGARNPIVFEDNSYHIENLTDNEIVSGQIVFSPLSSTQKDAVLLFYDTNKDISFDYVNPKDGVTYTLYFTDPVPYVDVVPETNPFQYVITYTVIGE